jgi:hypothetical protein
MQPYIETKRGMRESGTKDPQEKGESTWHDADINERAIWLPQSMIRVPVADILDGSCCRSIFVCNGDRFFTLSEKGSHDGKPERFEQPLSAEKAADVVINMSM